jgi:Mn2+/Fe2+ NRAMP family transporter
MNGVFLPAILVLMLLLVSRTSIMGDLANSPAYSVFCWALCVLVTVLDAVFIGASVLPHIGG